MNLINKFIGVIHRHPEAKGNSRQIARRGGRSILIKSDKAQAFMNQAVAEIKQQANGWSFRDNAKLRLECVVWYPDYRHDLDISLVKDALEKSGLIPNDRQIREEDIRVSDVKKSEIWVIVRDIGDLPWTPRTKKAKGRPAKD